MNIVGVNRSELYLMYFLRSLSVTLYYSAVNDCQMFLSVGKPSVKYLDAKLLSPHSWEDFSVYATSLPMVEGVHLDQEQ
jgi:hypothetical protein